MAKSRKSIWTEAYDVALTQVMKDLGMEQHTTCQEQQQQVPLPTAAGAVVAHSWSTVQKALAEVLQQQQSSSNSSNNAVVCCSINAKQCRDRWLNHLAPGIIKGNWTAEEKDIIVQMATAAEVYSFRDMAEKLPGRPCADIKNMYHSLMRSGKIVKSGRPRPVDRSRGVDQPVGQQQPQLKPSQLSPSSPAEVERDGKKVHKRKETTPTLKTTTTADEKQAPQPQSQERPKKKYRPSGIPLVTAPPFASPNTTNAARVLMSLDVTSNSTWPGAATEVTTDSSTDKLLNYYFNNNNSSHHCGDGWGNNGDSSCTVVSALPCSAIDEEHAESGLMNDYCHNSSENVVCKVYIHKPDNNNNTNEGTAGPPPQLLGFATLPSTHLTFAQARTVLQTELAAVLQQQQQHWCFTVPGQGRLTLDQESKLRVDFLVTPDALGTVSAPLPVSLVVVSDHSCSSSSSDQDDNHDEKTDTSL